MDLSPGWGQPGVTLEKGGQRETSLGAIIWKGEDTITSRTGLLSPASLLLSEQQRDPSEQISPHGGR